MLAGCAFALEQRSIAHWRWPMDLMDRNMFSKFAATQNALCPALYIHTRAHNPQNAQSHQSHTNIHDHHKSPDDVLVECVGDHSGNKIYIAQKQNTGVECDWNACWIFEFKKKFEVLDILAVAQMYNNRWVRSKTEPLHATFDKQLNCANDVFIHNVPSPLRDDVCVWFVRHAARWRRTQVRQRMGERQSSEWATVISCAATRNRFVVCLPGAHENPTTDPTQDGWMNEESTDEWEDSRCWE